MSLKAKILGGTRYTEPVYVERYQEPFRVRALSSGEEAQIESDALTVLEQIDGADPEIKGKLKSGDIPAKINKLLIQSNREKNWKIAAMAIVDDEPWTVEDVKKLDSDVVDKIVEKALALSKGTKEDRNDLISFPGGAGGQGDNVPDQQGV